REVDFASIPSPKETPISAASRQEYSGVSIRLAKRAIAQNIPAQSTPASASLPADAPTEICNGQIAANPVASGAIILSSGNKSRSDHHRNTSVSAPHKSE